jgi:hypothetical protein
MEQFMVILLRPGLQCHREIMQQQNKNYKQAVEKSAGGAANSKYRLPIQLCFVYAISPLAKRGRTGGCVLSNTPSGHEG